MSVLTYPALWPTEDSLAPLGKELAAAYNGVEDVVSTLKAATEREVADQWPEPLPTIETVGVVWNYLDTLRMEIDQLTRKADELEELLGEINRLRLDHVASLAKEIRAR